jgi:type II secretory pathway component GspD/PulD (secretin)
LGVAVANLLKEARGEVLAKPQITTIDNTEASIFMGEQIPIRVLDANGRQAVQLQDAGTSLTVTPHVTADGRVLLDLKPEKNSFRNDPSAGVVIQKQSAHTTVLVNDGETVVIAGLTTKEESEVETGVPLLKDIPILGWLFKHKSHQTRKRDLIIFVTPHVVRTSGAKATAMKTSGLEEREGVYGDLGSPAASGGEPATNAPAASTPPEVVP